jgi:hypothetical protein
MINRIMLFLIMLSGNLIYGQESDCKVILPRLSGTYKGECKNGFAHGNGLAQGIDRYEGEFRKGMPEGRGVYRWADGTFYDGSWKKGLREGYGKMIYSSDSTITGYWKADKDTGKQEVRKYEVLQSRYVARSTFIRISNSPLQVKIRFTLGGVENTTISDLSLTYSSGEEFRMGTYYGIQNVTFPVNVRIQYVTWNTMHTVQTVCTFEFKINEPGTWDVNIQN